MKLAVPSVLSMCMLTAIVAAPAPAEAQVGIGGRLAFVKVDSDTDDSVRFTGGHIRFSGERTGLEVSLDRRTEEFEALNERVKETPIQASLLLFLGGSAFKPYLLAGPGWYRRTVESLDDTMESVSTRKFGWHGGFGAELRMGRHAGVHADYRYTFLKFDDDDEEESSFISRVLPSHDGSMWTVGVTIYF